MLLKKIILKRKIAKAQKGLQYLKTYNELMDKAYMEDNLDLGKQAYNIGLKVINILGFSTMHEMQKWDAIERNGKLYLKKKGIK